MAFDFHLGPKVYSEIGGTVSHVKKEKYVCRKCGNLVWADGFGLFPGVFFPVRHGPEILQSGTRGLLGGQNSLVVRGDSRRAGCGLDAKTCSRVPWLALCK